ncbi:hypothetical protein BG004_005805 [Podila humilis]|nr:hypothetical protein BG004_005805 [Podila humilis]
MSRSSPPTLLQNSIPHRDPDNTVAVGEESTPLLQSDRGYTAHENPTSIYVKVLEIHLPWHKRPSAIWLFPLFGVMAISGGMLTSTLGQYEASLLCREFLNNHTPTNATLAAIIEGVRASPGGLTKFLFDSANMEMNGMMAPLHPAHECLEPDIQAFTAKVLGIVNVLGGITGTLTIGYYASMSDNYGRLRLMVLAPLNSLWLLTSIALMGFYWDQIGLQLMFLGMILSGLLGGLNVVGTVTSLAYIADCTHPGRRNLIPFLGGSLAEATKTIMTIVYVDATITILSIVCILFVIPESLPTQQSPRIYALLEQALQGAGSSFHPSVKNDNKAKMGSHWFSHVFESLQYFKPNGQNTDLIILGVITLLASLALKGKMSVIILYTNKVFHWKAYEDGILFSSASFVRLVTLLGLLPLAVHFYNRSTEKQLQLVGNGESTEGSQISCHVPRAVTQRQADMRFDIWMIRLGFVISSITYFWFGFATEGWMFYLASAIHAVCIIGVPSTKSFLTNLVAPSEFGAALGAFQIVESVSGMISPLAISWVYAATVDTRPDMVWYAVGMASTICTVLSFVIPRKEPSMAVV